MKPKNQCPLNNFERCKGLECSWYMQLMGNNPNTGQEIEEWGCAVSWLPILLIENSQQSRQAGAAVESFRNEVTKRHDEALRLAEEEKKNAIEIQPRPRIIEAL